MEVERQSLAPGAKPRPWLTTVAVAALCSLLALGIGLSVGGRRGTATPTVSPAAREASREIRMAPELVARAGIKTARVVRRTLSPTLELVGSVDFDADRVADVGGRISGRVARIYVQPGSDVLAGAPLAEIESANLGEAIATFLSARANSVAARNNLARQIELNRQQLTTARELEQARANTAALDAEIRGAEQRLLAMGVSPAAVHSLQGQTSARPITLRAPIAGRVVSRQAVLGQSVEPTSTIVRIADLTELWVQLDVFEKDLARVRINDAAEIASETYPGRTFHGVVNYIDSTIDTRTRTARVRIEVDNPELLLRPGQFVTARVRTGTGGANDAGPREAIAIPRDSLVQIEGRPAAFVALGGDRFEARSLELGVTDGDQIEVVRGISAGEMVVTDGAFAIKSELQR